jgi:hypothetical protein
MTNSHRGEIKINIGGRDRVIKFNLNTLALIQADLNNRPILDILEKLDRLDINAILVLLFRGLQQDDKSLTKEMVGDWDIDIQDTILKLSDSLVACLGVSPEGEK